MEEDDSQPTHSTPDGPAADTQPAGHDDPSPEVDSDEIDLVDFQSMQSFPASDVPTWPVPAALKRTSEAG